MYRTYRYRIYPKPVQAKEMERQLEALRRLYNAMLEQRRWYYKEGGISLSEFDQVGQLRDVRTMLEYKSIYSHVTHDVARRVDLAFQSFFRRVKAGEKAYLM